MYWASVVLNEAFNHAEIQWGLSTCLNAPLIHILGIHRYIHILFWKQTQEQGTDNIKEEDAEGLSAIVYDKYIDILFNCFI